MVEGQSQSEIMSQSEATGQPDLRTLTGQLSFLDYHSPDERDRKMHEVVNRAFQNLWIEISSALYEGPGKTVALRAVGNARMQCNSVIANKGA